MAISSEHKLAAPQKTGQPLYGKFQGRTSETGRRQVLLRLPQGTHIGVIDQFSHRRIGIISDGGDSRPARPSSAEHDTQGMIVIENQSVAIYQNLAIVFAYLMGFDVPGCNSSARMRQDHQV